MLYFPSKKYVVHSCKKTVNLEWLQKNQDIVFRMVVGKRMCTMDGSGTLQHCGV